MIKKLTTRCPNMNHGRLNVQIKFCPMCGETLNKQANGSCTETIHADRRRNRNTFCHDCGKKLATK